MTILYVKTSVKTGILVRLRGERFLGLASFVFFVFSPRVNWNETWEREVAEELHPILSLLPVFAWANNVDKQKTDPNVGYEAHL